jgi:hypothetical protein
MKRSLSYLGVPYSHPDPAVREARYRAVNKQAAKLMRAGHMVFSPISHCHPIAKDYDLPTDWEYWKTFARTYLGYSHTLYILCLDGWEESVGVTGEIEIAKEMQISVAKLF